MTGGDQAAWLRDLLLDRIQFHIWSDATAEDVQKVINDLSEGDAYDDHVAALVRMPKWCAQSEAQAAVDQSLAALSSSPPSEREVEAATRLQKAIDTWASQIGFPRQWPNREIREVIAAGKAAAAILSPQQGEGTR